MGEGKLHFSTIFVAAAALIFSLAYFVKAKEPILQIVSPDKIMTSAVSLPNSTDSKFAEMVMNSSSYAVFLCRSEYSSGNANSLEALRGWAAQQFHNDPRFLHPVILPRPTASSTFLNSTASCLFSAPYYLASQAAAGIISKRVDSYCDSESFRVFKNDFAGLFGSDAEAATLLARYQSDRARTAINPLLSVLLWLLTALLSPFLVRPFMRAAAFWRAPFMTSSEPALARKTSTNATAAAAYFSYFVSALGVYYTAQALVVETTAAPSAIAAIVCGAAALYVLFPVKVFVDNDEVLLLRSTITTRSVVISAWLFLSVLSIQMLTWIKQGVLTEPDPISLLISACTGDFIHDPLTAKRWISTAIALAWSASFVFILKILSRRGSESSREVTKKLAGLGAKL
ncbi:MAG: hypothetical protein Q8T09_13160 [Candidatus Melainabacteria bacterium]|nr:hypothetical protein [Candidatus Melainabacteria bacterium]